MKHGMARSRVPPSRDTSRSRRRFRGRSAPSEFITAAWVIHIAVRCGRGIFPRVFVKAIGSCDFALRVPVFFSSASKREDTFLRVHPSAFHCLYRHVRGDIAACTCPSSADGEYNCLQLLPFPNRDVQSNAAR